MARILFAEEQRFTQWWLWAIMLFALLSVLVPFLYGIYSQEVLNKSFGNQPMSTEGLAVTGTASTLLVLIIIVVFNRARLKTKISSDKLAVAFPPFFRKWKELVPGEIERYEIREYNAIREYGGYGVKRRFKYGQSYTISGNIGLQLYLKNGKRLLIGTQKRQAIEYAMRKLKMEENSAKNG